MNTIRATAMTCAAWSAGVLFTGQAHAAVDQYSAPASSEVTINLDVCSLDSQLAVRGDTGTDLDFFITDQSGSQLYSDEGTDDYLSLVLEQEREECGSYYLRVVNLGEEDNDFTVLLEPISESSARVQKYIIQPNETRTINFRACGTSAQVSVRGDGDTDLDFVIRNSDDGVVHENDDLTDEIVADLAGLLGDCERFEMDIINLGEVYNAAMLVVEPEGVTAPDFNGEAPTIALASGPGPNTGSLNVAARPAALASQTGSGSYRAEANGSIRVGLPVCGATRLEVRGDGDTDLDFTVTDEAGNPVHADADLSDATYATLTPPGECENYELRVDNLGGVFNQFSVELVDPDTRRGASGPGEYRVNAALATKVPLRVCAPTNVRARGDGDSDLDFEVIDSSGSVLHEDYDMTDATQFTLDPGGSCADYQLKVSNLGEVYNLLTVDFDGSDAPASGTMRSGAASASASASANTGAGFAKGGAVNSAYDRNIIILNRSGEAFSSVFWSNSATFEWGDNMLSDDATLAAGADWSVDVDDGSSACLFDFRALTQSNREIRMRAVNVCDIASVTME